MGETFKVSLSVAGGEQKQTDASKPENKEKMKAVRPIMQSTDGVRFTASWKVTSVGKEPQKDALVHFYVVRIEKPGQAPPALEPTEVVIETAQTMDFATGSTTSAELQFKPDRAGVYLIRIEAEGSAGQDFAAIDLVVKEGVSK
jgi:hypothetical protein